MALAAIRWRTAGATGSATTKKAELVEAWYNATDPANSGAGNTRYDGFAYDALGNRTQNNYVASRGLTSFVRRDNGLNQYSSWSPSVIYHDDNSPWPGYNAFPGNGVTMADGWLVASYNALNQPVAMVPFGWSDAIFFGYDPLGRCVKRWVGGSSDVYSNPATYFHYDGWNLLQKGNNAWGPARVYVHGNRMDEIVWSYNTFTGEQAFHHYDARGHCTLLTDSDGSIFQVIPHKLEAETRLSTSTQTTGKPRQAPECGVCQEIAQRIDRCVHAKLNALDEVASNI